MADLVSTALQTILKTLPGYDEAEYAAWLKQNSFREADRRVLEARLSNGLKCARLSVLVAAGAGEDPLRKTLESLRRQVHPASDIVIGCTTAQLSSLRAVQAEFPSLPTVLAVVDTETYDVFALERIALESATGSYVAFLGCGDILAPEAIGEVILALDRRSDVFILYTDEDTIDTVGRRSNPRFKTSWDPDAQLAFDLMGRFSPMKREVALEAGGLRAEHGLAAHYGLHCRVAELAGPARILHLPAMLVHTAEQPITSTALADEYAVEARRVAANLALFLEGQQVEALAAPLAPWFTRIKWPVTQPPPLVSILMPTRDRAGLVRAAARGVLEETQYPNFELLILDNGSVEQETAALFKSLSADQRVRVLQMPGPFNYSKLNNDGATAARGEVLLLLNNDIEVLHPDWLTEMVSLVVRDEIGCVGAKLLYANERIQHAGVNMAPFTGCAHVGRQLDRRAPGYHGELAYTRTLSAVTAACLAIRKNVFEETGGLDETHLQVGYNDVDLCLRCGDLGYRSVITPFAVLFHMESVSRGPNDNPLKEQRERDEKTRIMARWRDIFLDDPFQNPNTHLSWEDPSRLIASRRLREWETWPHACKDGRYR